MDRFGDLDLECDDEGSAPKTSLFGGKLKIHSKPADALTKAQTSSQNLEIPTNDDDQMDKSSKEAGKSFSGMFKKSPKLDRVDKKSQEDLSSQSELSGSTNSLSKSKESSGILGRMFKKSPKPSEARSQEDLSGGSEPSGSTDDLSENPSKEKGTFFGGMFKKRGAKFQSQEDLSVDDDGLVPTEQSVKEHEHEHKEKSGLSKEKISPVQKPKSKQADGMTKSTFYTETPENIFNHDDEPLDNGEIKQSHKQSKLAGAVSKLNPFRSANKQEKLTGSEDEDSPASSRKVSGDKQQVKSNPDVRGKSETPTVPPRPTEEEMKRTSTHNKVKPSKTEDKKKGSNTNDDEKFNNEENPPSHKQNSVVEAMSKLNPFRSANNRTNENAETPKETAEPLEQKPELVRSNTTQQERRMRNLAPPVPPRPTEEEIRGASPNEDKPRKTKDKESNPREKKEDPVGASVESQSGVNKDEESVQRESNRNDPESNKTEDEDKDSSSKEDRGEEDGDEKEKAKAKVRKPKKHNPFMPRVKAKVKQRNAEERAAENPAENEGANRSLFDQLEDFRVDPRPPENSEDVEDLMDWWNTVESWEDTPQDDDMTEKEEAKAFAVTAEKVQKGIHVFNKLFSERGESLWQHIMDLNAIADGLDKFNKKTKIAQITGGSTSAIGGVATITGLALAPVTMGTSLIVTAVGLGVATAGGLTSAGAGISNQVNNSMDRKKVEKIVEDYQEKIADFNKCLKFIKQGIDNLRKFNLLKMKNHAYNQDFPALTSSFYEDGAMAGKAILINANEIMRVVQIANVAGSTAGRAVQVASMATGVLTGLFVGMDIYFVAKDSKILKKGAKSEFAAKIREVAEQLHDGLVELNTIRMELQSTQPENNTGDDGAPVEEKKMGEEKKYSSSDEDEIDQIKKQIKKDIENREYV
ncbi:histone acetyltransferase KAT6B isoform X4 [Oryzias melastigma]|uniref:histone acetyltransferase KAT6B isoform X4 n=1 Tax=Oryzias melastigma TaxID=30732 RepID=UPI00168D1905|nr:histone acetyltransferase KAT6B isoform X4 [Oryzias melastigma]